ncbi:MAG: hypothetical protein A3H57_00560 [Candidatus Taylorbacteria bacterium RIFCSPLOWO2_02_FULL_43_11]|uniref:Phosphoribosyltransferase domain-containing protein n=1 Tax=Candidatus Taylorbacteria bacterium RIFCSPHIGHO2_02_FULL_43_32b TaxID=1802306 RepID=A0A1G2MKF2_9BACT|nr:MAG: hypothetical protein A2743_00550 [Candidatus Taylorbacteria bacterium RIFCSPHIGHO2_01_FULL_43_47]OHA24214.1 MAG: hypothetical protein A3C72_04945 [Candidatus Taylorbacteria bacterium RIFCSPHIGHO2_02_FULL_43_32b]OHA31256.1 MAG: hypothetical protein A3B08_00265 [Candidatus Taylorbacteria bacterium RIFCSPLOWO2_01_FULL_43_44]OHA37825.1 MAG: hypothetical protein A3H57_00560 [Candidatus Taylorbacteria bacterium RIFCSPLOWO2_02_FULL_43_11]
MSILFKIKKISTAVLEFLLPLNDAEKAFKKLSLEEFVSRAKTSAPVNIKDAKTLFSYQDKIVKSAIHLLKYKKDDGAAKLLGQAMANVAEEWLNDLQTFENFKNPVLIPVPMSKEHLVERGENHTEKLCLHLLNFLPKDLAKVDTQSLKKAHDTKSQVKTASRSERLKNLSGSFEANEKICGKNILLIDDVITTGATIEECRKTLYEKGARRVMALAIAH